MAMAYETVVLVTRKTELDELVARFATESQARFYLEQAGHGFDAIKASHDSYYEVCLLYTSDAADDYFWV